jgi:excisionase family DNA binding protein
VTQFALLGDIHGEDTYGGSRMKFLSPNEVAEIMGFNPATVYRAIERGHLRATKPPGTNRIRIAEDDLRRWLAAGLIRPASPMSGSVRAGAQPRRGRFASVVDVDGRRTE